MDQGERVLRTLAEITGLRGETCPWQATRDPFVAAVLQLHGDLKRGLSVDPDDLPMVLVEGLREYERALSSVTFHDWEQERQERDRERQARERRAPNFHRPLPRGGRRR